MLESFEKRRAIVLFAAMLMGLAATPASAQDRIRDRIGHREQSQSAPPAIEGTEVILLEVGSETRTYRLHLPTGLGASPAPLVMALHGLDSNAAQQEQISGFSQLADREGFIAVYPEGRDAKWRFIGRTDADVAFLEAVIEDAARRHPLQRSQMLVTGISNGAQMAWRMVCDRPGLFSGVGFVSGGFPDECPKSPHPPTMIFHGTSDRVLPYRGRAGQMAIPEFAAAWASCPLGAKGTPVDTNGEARSVRFACAGGADTLLYTIKGKGHSWPGSNMPRRITTQDVNASEAMLTLLAPR
jgi:polyhydroxybutyrate depolymerase